MKQFFTTVLLAITVAASAQSDTGMHFEHGLSWQQVKEKARAENKYIFMDAFTTWCGPCRMMAKTIFPLKDVGEFFNANYINVKVQLDSTLKDNEEVKAWYADAHDIMKSYKVNVFPTYLFFSPEGKLVHRAIGSSEASVFIGKGKDALDPSKQYYTLAERFKNGDRDPEFLKSVADAALNAYDRPALPAYTEAYIKTQPDILTEQNLKFLGDVTYSSKDPGFAIIMKNAAAFNKVVGEGKAEERIRQIVMSEEVNPAIYGSDKKPEWQKIDATLAKKYPTLAKEISANARIGYYYNQQEWPAFSKAVSAYIKQYSKNVSAQMLNQYAWRIFEACDDMACVNQALAWSKQSVDLTNNPMFMDTYANLLYKTGKKDLAIQWEEKALQKAKDNNEELTDYETSLGKMKKGEKTW